MTSRACASYVLDERLAAMVAKLEAKGAAPESFAIKLKKHLAGSAAPPAASSSQDGEEGGAEGDARGRVQEAGRVLTSLKVPVDMVGKKAAELSTTSYGAAKAWLLLEPAPAPPPATAS